MAEGRLLGQVAIITGASRGIGRACAEALAAEGAGVLLLARDLGAVEMVAATLRAKGCSALAVAGDVRDEHTLATVVDAAEEELGPVTLLVNNAGTPGPVGAEWQLDPETWW